MRDGDVLSDLDTAFDGLYNHDRFLQLLASFTELDSGAEGLTKRIAKPYQYFAVTKAVGSTIEAVRSKGASRGKVGIVWHTQRSGKSMEMELHTNQVMRRPELRQELSNRVTGCIYFTTLQKFGRSKG